MSLDSLYPFAGDHAIQSAVFALEWPAESLAVPQDPSTSLVAYRDTVRSALAHDFQHVEDLMVFSMSMGPMAAGAGQLISQPTPQTAGFTLSRRSSIHGWPARTITVSPEHILIQINDYSRWENIRSDLRRYLLALLPLIKGYRPVAAIGLQIVDLFNWKNNPEQLQLAEVFRENSKYLPSNVMELTGLWHSHHGFLTSQSEPYLFDQLDNINVSRISTDGVDAIQIVGSHRAKFPVPRFIGVEDDIDCQVIKMQDHLHEVNKDILREILADGVLGKLKSFGDNGK